MVEPSRCRQALARRPSRRDEVGDDLIERLRSRKGEAITRVERLMDEAANRIEAQEMVVKELRAAIINLNSTSWEGDYLNEIRVNRDSLEQALSKAKSQQEGETE